VIFLETLGGDKLLWQRKAVRYGAKYKGVQGVGIQAQGFVKPLSVDEVGSKRQSLFGGGGPRRQVIHLGDALGQRDFGHLHVQGFRGRSAADQDPRELWTKDIVDGVEETQKRLEVGACDLLFGQDRHRPDAILAQGLFDRSLGCS
jgi:hypothetical protein